MTEETKKEVMTTYRTPNGLGKIIHIAAWGILFGIPFFFTGRESETVTIESYTRFVIMPISFMFVFYVNYFFPGSEVSFYTSLARIFYGERIIDRFHDGNSTHSDGIVASAL